MGTSLTTLPVCVAGLVVLDTGTHWTFFGQLAILIIHVGGLGVMSFVTFFALAQFEKPKTPSFL